MGLTNSIGYIFPYLDFEYHSVVSNMMSVKLGFHNNMKWGR